MPTTVPPWIAKAVIFTPGYHGDAGKVAPILDWRATDTQVVVDVMYRGERVGRRFRLDTLTQVGHGGYGAPQLMAPDAPTVLAAQAQTVADEARRLVLGVVQKQRLQDGAQSADAVLTKLIAVQDAVNKAIASLGPVL